jgi:2-oxoisovalerate dehydrogenase E1 component
MQGLASQSVMEWLHIYRKMQRVRRFEEKSVTLFRAGELPGFLHPSVGQEASAIGFTHYLGAQDFITTTHRGHGHIIGKGATPDRMFAELFAKETGYCRGRGGSMHIMDRELGVLGANGIVGGGLPIAVGAGLTSILDDSHAVTVCFFGDGAGNEGTFHESLNLASLWKLPVVFVCENNQYAESTPFHKATPIPDLSARGAAYGMPAAVIDGNDIVAVLETAEAAIKAARAGEGPTLIQSNTYRWYGHHMGDTAPYRTEEELEQWKAKDPIARLAKGLLMAGMVTEEQLAEVVAEVDAEIEAAVEFARSSPDPDPAEVLNYVYIDCDLRPEPVPGADGPREATMREALQLALRHELESDPDVFLMGEDLADPMGGSFKITAGLSTDFGEERIRNTPISEAIIAGAGVGSAMTGKRPVVEIMYFDFMTVAMDQVVNQAGLIRYMSGGQLKVPATIRCQGGAWRASAAQHAKNLEAWFAHVPGLKVTIPSTPNDAYWLLRRAIRDDNPTIFYEPNLLYGKKGILDVSACPDDLDRAAIRRAGTDLTIVTWGYISLIVMEAAEELARRGISTEVIDLRHMAPLPMEDIIASVAKTGLCCVIHEAWETGGLGGEVVAQLNDAAFYYLDGPVKRIGAQHSPHPFAPILEHAMMPDKVGIVDEIMGWFEAAPTS